MAVDWGIGEGVVDYRTWGRRWPSAVMGEFDAWMSSPNSLHPLLPSHTHARVEGEEAQWLGRITFARMLIHSPTHMETNKLEVLRRNDWTCSSVWNHAIEVACC